MLMTLMLETNGYLQNYSNRVFKNESLFSSSEPSGSLCELIVYPCSGFRRPSVVRNVQTSSPLKLLGQIKPNFMWSLLLKGGLKFM